MFKQSIKLLAQLLLFSDLLGYVLVLDYPFSEPSLPDGLVQLTWILSGRCFLDHEDSCTLGILRHGDSVPAHSFTLALDVASAEVKHILTLSHDLNQQILEQLMELVLCLLNLKKIIKELQIRLTSSLEKVMNFSAALPYAFHTSANSFGCLKSLEFSRSVMPRTVSALR